MPSSAACSGRRARRRPRPATTEDPTRTPHTARAAAARRQACLRAQVKRLADPGDLLDFDLVPSTRLAIGDHVLCTPGDLVACDGALVAGAAVVRAVPDAPGVTVREAGVAPAAVAAGAIVLAGHLVVRVTAVTA